MSTVTKPGVKRFLLFVYCTFDPDGGWDDLHGAFDDFSAAIEARDDYGRDPLFDDWSWQIVDQVTGEVFRGDTNRCKLESAGSPC